jgi:hypothetical protein
MCFYALNSGNENNIRTYFNLPIDLLISGIGCLKSSGKYVMTILFCKKTFWFYKKSSLKLISSKCSSLWLSIYVILGGRVFQHSRHFYGYQLLIADLINYSYDTEFIQRLLKKNEKKLCTKFGDFGDRIYPVDLEIKDTTYTSRSASYLDLHLEINWFFYIFFAMCEILNQIFNKK